MKRLMIAAATLVVSVGLAHAGDNVMGSGDTNWTGFYAGVFGGTGDGTIDPIGLNHLERAPGSIYGVQLGGDLQTGQVVVGIQTELTQSNMAWTDEIPPDTINWLGSTTARVGIAIANVLPYFKAGVAYANGTGSASHVAATATGYGWTGGIGVDIALSDHFSFFAEDDIYQIDPTTLDFGFTTIEAAFAANIAKAGVNVRF